MSFTSLQYVIFLPLVIMILKLTAQRYRHFVLLASSLAFYGFFSIPYLLLMILDSWISYISAKAIARTQVKYKRNILFYSAVIMLLIFLVFFKYIVIIKDIGLILPLGISFYTFQTLSYLIDVYNDRTVIEDDFAFYLLYVTFFPQLVAGPIERKSHLMPYLKGELTASTDQKYDGIYYLLRGYMKKILAADYIATYVDKIYSMPDSYSGSLILIATVLFAIQIYADFSGYSEIAIGSAKLLGIDLSMNFDCPYKAMNVQDFFRRWHMTLNRWFRDYIYFPMGGNKRGIVIQVVAVNTVFILSGIWHGAGLHFAMWGLFLGFIMSIELIYKHITGHNISSHIYLVTIVTLSWILFRSSSMAQALLLYKKVFTDFDIKALLYFASPKEYIFILLAIVSVILADNLPKVSKTIQQGSALKFNVYMSIYTLAITVIWIARCLEVSGGKDAAFIYFQF